MATSIKKIYRVIDNSSCVLTTTDELKAFRLHYRLMQKHEEVQSWGWIDTEVLK